MTSPADNSEFPSPRWCRVHRNELLQWFPEDVVNDPRRVSFIVQEAIDFETGWSPDWLTEEDARTLLRFLHRHVDGGGWDLISQLERRRAATGRAEQKHRQRR